MGTETVLESGAGTAIEEWWQDCEMMTYTYGRISITVRDYYPAFDRALQTYARALTSDTGGTVPPANRARGFTLLFGPGDYHFSRTPTLIRGMHLLGQGAHGQSAYGTRFRYANGIDGLHPRFQDTPATPPTAVTPPGSSDPPRSPIGGGLGRSEYSVVENIAFVGQGAGASENHGIWALAPIQIRNCIISNWGGNGIRMTSAPEGAAFTSSTNHSLVEHCTVQDCGWRGVAKSRKESWEPRFGDDFYDGIYVEGGNSNGSLFSAVHCTGNGRWGFYDESGTGCTFVACMAHGNGNVYEVLSGGPASHKLPDGGSYKVFLTAARSVLVGCYAELDQRPAEVSPVTLVLGGVMAVDLHQGQYLRSDGTRVLQLDAGVTVSHRSRGHVTVKGTLGTSRGDPGVAFEVANVEKNNRDGSTLNLKYDEYGDPPTAKTWSWRHAAENVMVIGVNAERYRQGKVGRPMSEGAIGRGEVYFPGGILLGHASVPEVRIKQKLRSGGSQGNIQGITKTQYVRIVGAAVPDVEKEFYEGYASGPPNADTWFAGDRLWNVNPQPGGWMGWVCTVGGSPGTWLGFGAIESVPRP